MYTEDTEGILRHWVTVVSVEGRDGMRQAGVTVIESRDTVGDKGDSTKLTSSE